MFKLFFIFGCIGDDKIFYFWGWNNENKGLFILGGDDFNCVIMKMI